MSYIAGATDWRLLPLVWSPRDIVRGYTRDGVAERASHISIVNLEARTPLAAVIGRPIGERLLPVSLFAFSDWARFAAPQTLALSPASRQLWSAGFGARVNAAGEHACQHNEVGELETLGPMSHGLYRRGHVTPSHL